MEMFSREWGRLFGEKNSAGKNTTGVLDVPGSPEVKNPPVNAEDTGSTPGLEDPTCRGDKQAHMSPLLKPACLEPGLGSKRSHHNEKPVHQN